MYSDFIDKKVKTERDFTGPNNKPLKMILSPIFHEQGNIVTGAVVEIVDLTELKAFQQRQVDFVSFISHELRTPITSAKGYLDVVLHEADYLQEDHKRFIERALLSTQRQADTVEKLIDLSNLEQGQLITNFEEVDIVGVIQEVVGYWKDVASNKSLSLAFIYPKFQVSRVKADVTLVRNVLNNLIDNAVKYTNEGSVEVSISQRDAVVFISVKDTGIGISNEVKDAIFNKFVRGEHSMTETTQGNGLGLYLSKRFVEQMGGKLTLESELTKGSTFTFTLSASKNLLS
jgi:two-component system sensor histidine kinase ResE